MVGSTPTTRMGDPSRATNEPASSPPPPTATRIVSRSDLFGELGRDGACSGHGDRVVEGVDEQGAGFVGVLDRSGEAFVVHVAGDGNGRPVVGESTQLYGRAGGGYEHHGRHAQHSCCPGDCLSVVATAGGADPGCGDVSGQEVVQGPPHLEGARELEGFQLQPELRVDATELVGVDVDDRGVRRTQPWRRAWAASTSARVT